VAGFAAVEIESADIVFSGAGGDMWADHETTIFCIPPAFGE
jgi:hypothetical protein